MDREYYTLPYDHDTCADICDYLHTLSLQSPDHYFLIYDSRNNVFKLWVYDIKYLTMIFLKFGGKEQ